MNKDQLISTLFVQGLISYLTGDENRADDCLTSCLFLLYSNQPLTLTIN